MQQYNQGNLPKFQRVDYGGYGRALSRQPTRNNNNFDGSKLRKFARTCYFQQRVDGHRPQIERGNHQSKRTPNYAWQFRHPIEKQGLQEIHRILQNKKFLHQI